ncbi:hypothetical protein E2C01_100246 [Portunus trituberculatus]|uniref:Uncharacterized protein n=1 Tax=Portunus trituberculatus TaxID=210409 RepID=A0A5B7K2I8_PORTR|nr:hypothetical protein [Portunus trituberculatus]
MQTACTHYPGDYFHASHGFQALHSHIHSGTTGTLTFSCYSGQRPTPAPKNARRLSLPYTTLPPEPVCALGYLPPSHPHTSLTHRK